MCKTFINFYILRQESYLIGNHDDTKYKKDKSLYKVLGIDILGMRREIKTLKDFI